MDSVIKYFPFVFICVFCSNAVVGQVISPIIQGNHNDSSFYHVARIDENEFWVGGESGILVSIDTIGNISNIKYPSKGLDLLKILPTENYIFLAASNATIYRFDREKGTFDVKYFQELEGKCFYDLIVTKDNKLLVCGGDNDIARGKKSIPRGFIGTIDMDLTNLIIVWKSFRRFVWKMEAINDRILAVTYNGFSTTLMSSGINQKWKKRERIKGLVHSVFLHNNEIWFSGTVKNRYKETGIWGTINSNRRKPNIDKTTGCLWGITSASSKILFPSYTGSILAIDLKTRNEQKIEVREGFSLYEVESISKTKFFVVGHGKSIYLLSIDSLLHN